MDKAKRLILTLSLLLLIPLVGLLIPSKVNATQFHFESYSLAKEDVVDEDMYIVGDEIRIDGIVHGLSLIHIYTTNPTAKLVKNSPLEPLIFSLMA